MSAKTTLTDTIVALSSGSLPSGVAVIRLSGPDSARIVGVLAGSLPEPREMHLVRFRDPVDGALLDEGLVVLFPGPGSFTGEDCAELHVHGSPAGVRKLLQGVQALGARLARGGEFTQRAFENGKFDLTRVEGLGDMLEAETEGQRQLAVARMSGGLTARLQQWREGLLDLSAEIEAQLDFSDESDVGELAEDWRERLQALREDMFGELKLLDGGRIIRDGFRAALLGAPNSGKSSLLNALARSEVAIVSPEAGTTRDTKDVFLDIDGQLIVLVDTAGLRETNSLAEQEGVKRAHSEAKRADLIVHLVAPDVPGETDFANALATECIRVGSKSDLGRVPDADLWLSAQTGEGLDAFRQVLRQRAANRTGTGLPLVSRERDRIALETACACLQEALEIVSSPELVAENLRLARESLGRLLGTLDSEVVLDRLFSGFCIGK